MNKNITTRRISCAILMLLLCTATDCFAQTKTKKKPKDNLIGPAPDTAKTSAKKKIPRQDSVRIIYYDNKGKQIISLDATPAKRVTDTVIFIGKKSKIAPAKDSGTKKQIIIQQPECSCVLLTVNAQDTLLMDSYINYVFSFKNTCKETVWINSGYFSFTVFDYKNRPVKVLRKLQYVKRYNYPEFVPLKPGTSFDFRFGDDPFFEYDLRAGWQYKFTFIYNNRNDKHKTGRSYLCTEFRDKMVSVK